ncbi:hypothetical protein [Psychrosphaera algicola]|uniref:Uncharacterized protein n=1 Tax=Psychrosphaera algicola TaxID=3023714 RepID=A0ABT5FI73_9GAMM|nr:hypothetical protein [Psychrosphaera sp. G1-22]MDC2890883.1 hypothetical protein [Psychrosphaera sp. G1-22]
MAVSSLVSFNTYALETESISNVIEKLFSDGAVLSIFILFALCLTGYLVYGLYRFRQYQGQITESEERLRLSLWASGDEMWDWNIHRGSLHRTNGAGTYPCQISTLLIFRQTDRIFIHKMSKKLSKS